VSLPPIWLLGSSGASARFAGELGLGYSFASHFSPTPAGPAIAAYKAAFRPSETFPRPHAILGAAVICAETRERAEYLAASFDLMWVRINRGEFKPIPTPEEAMAYHYTEMERAIAAKHRSLVFVGTAAEVKEQIEAACSDADADEVIITSIIHSHDERIKCYELLAHVFKMEGRVNS
jgi:luciferase family oxidoreductase group 1